MTNAQNNVQLIGYLGAAPQLKTFDSGSKVATCSIAITDKYTNSKGEAVEDTQWFRIEAWGKLADRLEKYEKGNQIMISGRLKTRSYVDEKEIKRYITCVNATSVFKHEKKSAAVA